MNFIEEKKSRRREDLGLEGEYSFPIGFFDKTEFSRTPIADLCGLVVTNQPEYHNVSPTYRLGGSKITFKNLDRRGYIPPSSLFHTEDMPTHRGLIYTQIELATKKSPTYRSLFNTEPGNPIVAKQINTLKDYAFWSTTILRLEDTTHVLSAHYSRAEKEILRAELYLNGDPLEGEPELTYDLSDSAGILVANFPTSTSLDEMSEYVREDTPLLFFDYYPRPDDYIVE